MNELINKISSYNLFNYLLPGAIFIAIFEKMTVYKIIQTDLLVNAFLVYFIGLVISRIGSLMVEPIFRKFVTFADYKDFISASKNDKKIEILSEANNTYRTFIALFVVVFILKSYFLFIPSNNYGVYILIFFLFILFIFSYTKQIKYITKRIQNINQNI
jgi:hypothetical protein